MAQSQRAKSLLVCLLFAAVLLVAKAGEPHSGQFQQEDRMTSFARAATSAVRRGLRDVQIQASAGGASAGGTTTGTSAGTPTGTPTGTPPGTSDGTSVGMSTVSVNGQSETVTCTKDAAGKVTCTKNGQPYAAPPGQCVTTTKDGVTSTFCF